MSKANNEIYWSTVIEPRDGVLKSLQLGELWRKRYLIWLFIKRDVIVQFKQTVFGMGWYFISPLFSVVMYMIVFGRIANIPTDDIPQPVFYLSGVCLWEYFSTCLTDVSNTFSKNAGLYGKVYFPRLVSPLSICVSRLFRFSIQLGMFVLVYLYFALVLPAIYDLPSATYHLQPTIYLLLFPVLVVMMAGLAMGLGLIVTSLTTKYKDLVNFFPTFVSLWMYATPIVYPMSYVTNPTLHRVMALNPMTPIIESFKYGAYGAGEFSWAALGSSCLTILVLLVLGVVLFTRKQKAFIDTI